MQRPTLLAAMVVAALAVLVAAPSLDYGFVYDDETVVVARRPFWEHSIAEFLASRPWGTGRHITAVSLDLDRLESGTVPRPFHRTNIALSAVLSLLVLALALRLEMTLAAATLAAALFAVHPTHVDSVDWIIGRAELLAALGCLACVLVAIRPVLEVAAPRLRVFAVSALAAFVAVHSKESALCLPLLLVLARALLGPRVALAPALGGTLVAVATWALWIGPRLATFERPQFVDNPLVYAPFFERIPKALLILADYARLCVWPYPLLPDRSWAATDPGLAAGWLATFAWLALALDAWRSRRLYPREVFALAWFPAAFAMTANVLSPIGTLMAERLLLLPSLGFCLLAALGVDRLGRWPVLRQSALIAGSGIVVLFFVFFQHRGLVWTSADSYFPAAVSGAPRSAKAWYDYGSWNLLSGRRLEAEDAFARALAIVPSLSRAAQKRAESMGKRGEPSAGAEVYLAYLETAPDDTGAITNVIRLLLDAGRAREAVEWSRRLVEKQPGDQLAIDTLVVAETALRQAQSAPPGAPPQAVNP